MIDSIERPYFYSAVEVVVDGERCAAFGAGRCRHVARLTRLNACNKIPPHTAIWYLRFLAQLWVDYLTTIRALLTLLSSSK